MIDRATKIVNPALPPRSLLDPAGAAGRAGRALVFAALSLGLAPAPRAALPSDTPGELVRAELLSEQNGLAPGSSALVGVRLHQAPHWHTYWTVPGDAGLPTRLRWTLDPGYSAGPIQWPAPSLLRVGDLANYGYEGDVLLPVALRVPDNARPGSSVRLAVHADWLVCSDLCIPGGADLTLELPVHAAADLRPGPDAAAFASALGRIPAPLALTGARAGRNGERIRLDFSGPRPVARTLAFFPLESDRIVAAAPQQLSLAGGHVQLELRAATPVDKDFTRLRGVLVADGGPAPQGQGWLGSIDLPLAVAAGAAGGPAAAAPTAPTDAALPAVPAPAAAVQGAAAAPPAPAPALPAPVRSATGLSLLVALAGAFVGGLILNLMPCVFPVLSLKLIGLVKHRAEGPERMRRHGLAFGAGVVLSFLVLAGALLGLRAAGAELGWGFQLQSPLVITALLALFFLIGLNLLGSFDFAFGYGLANSRAAQSVSGDGLAGSFATGVLAAVVASPCTAPFMGAALGFAVTQPAAVAIAVFAALGAGMATPYLVLTFVPSLLGLLPRPGAWMERLKHLMAFPMFLTCVWLFWVLGQQVDIDAITAVLAALVALAFAAWALGVAQRGAPGFRWAAAAAAVATLAILAPLARDGLHPAPPRSAARAGAQDWSGWSPAAQQDALARGSPVFVDFTAAWCITCQANKRLVLHDASVESAFRQRGVVLLRADWTQRDERIAQELARFARSGVPMYVLYDRKGAAHLLPEILSRQGVLDALGDL